MPRRIVKVSPCKLPSAHRHAMTTSLHVHVAVVVSTRGIFQFQWPLGHGHGMNTWVDVDVLVEVCTHGKFQFYCVLVTLHWWVGLACWCSNFKSVPMPIGSGASAHLWQSAWKSMCRWTHVHMVYLNSTDHGLMTMVWAVPWMWMWCCSYVQMVDFKLYCVLLTLHWWVTAAHRQSNFKGVPMAIAIAAWARYDNLPACPCASGTMYTWYIWIPLTMASWPWSQQLPACRCAGAGMYTWYISIPLTIASWPW